MLKHSNVLRCRKKRRDENQEGLGLDAGAIIGVEQVEEDVHVDFATEDDARRRVQQEKALDIRQRG